MKDIRCPNCGTTFQLDDTAYAAILQQVRTAEFESAVSRRVTELRDQFKDKEAVVKANTEKAFEHRLSEKDMEMGRLRNEITRLQGLVAGADAAKRSELSALETAKAKELFAAVSGKDRLIAELQSKINAEQHAADKRESELRRQHQLQLSDKQAEIERLRDFRLRMSTKMVGETLEQHCAILFEQAQCNGLYPDATFEKDNTAVEHTKGDFIFRDYIDGTEYVSIMFEMKNEMDATAVKHRNEDFLDKLDKDRSRKGCEYAVLVSMLEQDSELYNSGIVDKSHRYPKMLVIRPQFFMPVLRLISEGARKGFLERHALVQELEAARNQSIDFSHFEEKLNRFRTAFGKSVTDAHKKFTAATDGIDKVIEALERQIRQLREVKANFEASEQKLLKANDLAEESLTVKKLTYGNPTVRRMIDDAK